MSFFNFQNSLKFLNSAFIEPTKSLFSASDQASKSSATTNETKNSAANNNHAKIHNNAYDDTSDDTLGSNGLMYRRELNDPNSASTASSIGSSRPRHKHTKSLHKLAEEQGVDAIKIHNGEIEVFQTAEVPLLFAKGGFDNHVATNNPKPTHAKKYSMQGHRKGGFVKYEDYDEDEPFGGHEFSSGMPGENWLRSDHLELSSNRYKDDVDNFLSGKLEFVTKSNRSSPIKIQKKEFSSRTQTFDPLGGSDPLTCSKTNNKIKKTHTRASSAILPELIVMNPAKNTLQKSNLQLSTDNTSLQSSLSLEKDYRFQKGEFFNQKDEETLSSKSADSMVVMEDQTSELDINFGGEIEEEEEEEVSEYEQESSSYNVIFGSIEERDNNPPTQTPQTLPESMSVVELYKSIQQEALYMNGIHVIPTSDPQVWSCLVFIYGGLYEKGRFRFNIHIPTDYPEGRLKVYSQTKIYHPLINYETGEVDIKKCNANGQYKLIKVLSFLKTIFNDSEYLEEEHSFNNDAARKYIKNIVYFKIKVEESIKSSMANTLLRTESSNIKSQTSRDDVRRYALDIIENKDNISNRVESLIESVMKSIADNA